MPGSWQWPHQEDFNHNASTFSFPALSLCSSLVSSPAFRRGEDGYYLLDITMIDSSGKVCGFQMEETDNTGRWYSKTTLLDSLCPIGAFIGCHDWFVPKGILARVHDRKLELHKLEIRAEEGGPSITTNITSSSASIGTHTEILLPTKGSCISFCECDQDKTGMIIAVGSSCGVLLYYLPPPPQLKGNDEFMQSCSVIVETVQGSLFSPHTTVAVACGGHHIAASDITGRVGVCSLANNFPFNGLVNMAAEESWVVQAPSIQSRVTCLAFSPDSSMLAIMYWDGGVVMVHQNGSCWSQFVPDSEDWRQRFGQRKTQHSIEERGGGLAAWSPKKFLALSQPNPPEIVVYNSVGWNCLVKVSCDAASYFHGLTSTAFLPPSLTTRNRYPAEGTGIVKQGFVALDFTGKFQFIMVPHYDATALSFSPMKQQVLNQLHEEQFILSDHLSSNRSIRRKNTLGSIIADSIYGFVSVAAHQTSSFLKSSPTANHSGCYTLPNSSSLVLDLIMANCSENGALIGESSASTAKHQVMISVPFLSSHAEVIGGNLQACSDMGSWEHGGYICLALPDICYITYVNKNGECTGWHAIYSPRQPILSVGLMHRTDLPGSSSSGLNPDSSFNCGNENLVDSSISLLILLADGSLELYPSIDAIASSMGNNDSRISAGCCRVHCSSDGAAASTNLKGCIHIKSPPPKSLLWDLCSREFPGFCKIVKVIELSPWFQPYSSNIKTHQCCCHHGDFKVTDRAFVCVRHEDALLFWKYTGSDKNNVLKLRLWHGCPLQVCLVVKCEAGHVAVLQSFVKNSIPGKWWLAGLEREGWKVLDLALEDDDDDGPVVSGISNENYMSSLLSFVANGAMASAVIDFSNLLLNLSCI
eukprot:512236_1